MRALLFGVSVAVLVGCAPASLEGPSQPARSRQPIIGGCEGPSSEAGA